MKETAISIIHGEDYFTLSTESKKYMNKLRKYAEQYPDDVEIKQISDSDYVEAYLPAKWFKFPKPPKKMPTRTPEGIQKSIQALADYRERKKKEI